MKPGIVLVLSFLLLGCGPAPTQTVAEQAAMQMEINEALAVSHMRSLVNAQAQAKSLNAVDTDADGWGEYLLLDELSGARPARTPGMGMRMPLLIDAFKHRGLGGYVEVHGYLFRLFLPGPKGTFVDDGEADPSLAEIEWRCYAWPVEYGRSGCRSFYVDQHGTVRGKEVPGLSGAHAPGPNAALGGGVGGAESTWGPAVGGGK